MITDPGLAHFRVHHGILAELAYPLAPGAKVLDFGCGRGRTVAAYRREGYDAVGCDVVLDETSENLYAIDPSDYRLPFADDSFDFVFSDEVMEHVRDHHAAFREIRRVLKPGAGSLHLFPSRWKPTEAHVFVPLAGVLQSRWWLRLWAEIGIRNEYQHGMTARDVAATNFDYLRSSTRYLTTREIREIVGRYFTDFRFVEEHLIKHTSGRARVLEPLLPYLPFLTRLYRAAYSHAVFVVKDGCR